MSFLERSNSAIFKNKSAVIQNKSKPISLDPKFESQIHKSISYKRASQGLLPVVTAKPKHSRKFETFFIIGREPQKQVNQPSILTMFPSTQISYSNSELEQIKDFCFPNGFTPLDPSIENPLILNHFIFTIKHDDEVNYGVCMYINASNGQLPFFASPSSKKYPFCLCLLTYSPAFVSHFRFLSLIAKLLTCQIALPPRINNFKQTIPLRGFCHPSLTMDKSTPQLAVFPGLRAPRGLSDELTFYRIQDPYSNVNQSNPSPQIREKDSKTVINRLIGRGTFHALFSSFGGIDFLKERVIPKIIECYTNILLEQRILFFSTSFQRASLSIFALNTLIYPFQPSSNIISILPENDNYAPFKDSPVPYLIGTVGKSQNGDVYVNLDSGEISINPSVSSFQLPEQKELEKKLQLILDQRSDIEIPQKTIRTGLFMKVSENPKFVDFQQKISQDPQIFPVFDLNEPMSVILRPDMVDQILTAFHHHLSNIVDPILPSCFATDSTDINHPITVLNQDLFLSHVNPEDAPFFQAFLNTHGFQEYTNAKTDAFAISRAMNNH